MSGKEERGRKSHKQQALQSFETLVTAEIQYERQSIQDELEKYHLIVAMVTTALAEVGEYEHNYGILDI